VDHGGTYRAAGEVVGGRYRLDGPTTPTSGVPAWRALDSWSGRPVTVHLVGPPAHLPPAQHGAWVAGAAHRAHQFALLRDQPKLAVVLDVVHHGGQLWTVTEWTTARSLDETVRTSGPIHPEHLRVIARELLEGLWALHGLGLTHGGVTPNSVLLPADRRVVLVCAGVPPDETAPARLLAYRSPEQLDVPGDDQASDVFSMGAVTYFAAQGRGPFDQGDDATATRYAVKYQQPLPPTRAGTLAGPILAMLAPRREARPTAAAALALLAPPGGYVGGGYAGGGSPAGPTRPFPVPPGAGPPGPVPPDQRRPSRRPLYAGAAVALIALVGIVVALVLTRANSSSAPNPVANSLPTAITPPPSSQSTISPSPSPSRSRPTLPTRPQPGGGAEPPGQTSPGTADDFDPSVRRDFLDSCTSATEAPDVCLCAIEEFEARYTQDEFVRLGRNPDTPESQEALNDVLSLCATTTDA
jgi:serine/threonine protein kinase